MLESVARVGIGQGKPYSLVITTFTVIFVSDVVLLIVCAYYVQDILLQIFRTKWSAEVLQAESVKQRILS